MGDSGFVVHPDGKAQDYEEWNDQEFGSRKTDQPQENAVPLKTPFLAKLDNFINEGQDAAKLIKNNAWLRFLIALAVIVVVAGLGFVVVSLVSFNPQPIAVTLEAPRYTSSNGIAFAGIAIVALIFLMVWKPKTTVEEAADKALIAQHQATEEAAKQKKRFAQGDVPLDVHSADYLRRSEIEARIFTLREELKIQLDDKYDNAIRHMKLELELAELQKKLNDINRGV